MFAGASPIKGNSARISIVRSKATAVIAQEPQRAQVINRAAEVAHCQNGQTSLRMVGKRTVRFLCARVVAPAGSVGSSLELAQCVSSRSCGVVLPADPLGNTHVLGLGRRQADEWPLHQTSACVNSAPPHTARWWCWSCPRACPFRPFSQSCLLMTARTVWLACWTLGMGAVRTSSPCCTREEFAWDDMPHQVRRMSRWSQPRPWYGEGIACLGPTRSAEGLSSDLVTRPFVVADCEVWPL